MRLLKSGMADGKIKLKKRLLCFIDWMKNDACDNLSEIANFNIPVNPIVTERKLISSIKIFPVCNSQTPVS